MEHPSEQSLSMLSDPNFAQYITKKFGAEFVPTKPNIYKTKDNAQDAHEAIRPTYIDLTPDKIKESLKINVQNWNSIS